MIIYFYLNYLLFKARSLIFFVEPISIQTPTERIKAALLELPIWAANEYVMVDKNQTEQYIRFTFVSNRGTCNIFFV